MLPVEPLEKPPPIAMLLMVVLRLREEQQEGRIAGKHASPFHKFKSHNAREGQKMLRIDPKGRIPQADLCLKNLCILWQLRSMSLAYTPNRKDY